MSLKWVCLFVTFLEAIASLEVTFSLTQSLSHSLTHNLVKTFLIFVIQFFQSCSFILPFLHTIDTIVDNHITCHQLLPTSSEASANKFRN